MEYRGLYDIGQTIQSINRKHAYILNEEPDIVYMEKMHVILYLNDEIESVKH